MTLGSQNWVAERITGPPEAGEAVMIASAADVLSVGAAGAGGVHAQRAACCPSLGRGERLGRRWTRRRGEVAGGARGDWPCYGRGGKGSNGRIHLRFSSDQGKGVNK